MANANFDPLFVLTIDSAESAQATEWRARLVHISSEGRKLVAAFASESLARDWIKAKAPKNEVLRPHEFSLKSEAVGFLNDLLASGDTDVLFFFSSNGPRFVPIRDLLKSLGKTGV